MLFDFLSPPTQTGDLGTLGHYRVLSELGQGGMGHVFLALDTKLKRSVALKVMNKKVASSRNSRKRFVREARAMAAVHHDNVVTIFEVGKSGGTPFIAMEMLKGQTLEQRNQSGTQLDYQQIINYARQIATGLAVAHEKGIVHRDIKPANIWIEEGTDRIKILDFGLALDSTPLDQLTGRGSVIGTPGYLSPEQARSEPLDDRSDLYSLGAVLYEICTGSLPVIAKSIPGQLVSIIAQRPRPIHKQNPDIPQPLCDLVHQLLRKEPRSRPKSATIFCEQLDQVELSCDAKSGVAITINNLQKGLSDIARKKDNPELA
jgi:serine/threonine protein kinase